jgi:hypothetical protein
MTAVLLVIALRTRADTGTDHADGVEREVSGPGAATAVAQAQEPPR